MANAVDRTVAVAVLPQTVCAVLFLLSVDDLSYAFPTFK